MARSSRIYGTRRLAEDDSDIARLEERIEHLSASRERCRKISLASKIAIAAGTAWIALTLLDVVSYNPALAFGSLAAAIGGIVLLGSNKTTWDQIEAALHDAVAKRNALIGGLPLRLVTDAPQTTLH